MLKLADVDREKFPDLIPNNGDIGPLSPSVARELGLAPSTRVLAGINDTNASAIGTGAAHDFHGILYIGTSAVLTCHIPFKKTDIFHMMASIPSCLDSKYLLMAEQGVGGKTLEHYLGNIVYAEDDLGIGPVPADVFERVNRMAERVPAGCEGVLFLPWLNGSLVPEENAAVRGGFFNLSLTTTRSHMTRAILEGIAYNNRWTAGPAERFVGRKFESFRFAGGGALSDVWAQIHADVLGVPIHRVVDSLQTTIRGVALYAFHSLGIRSLDELPGLVKIDKTFHPDETKRDVYDTMYEHFRSVYKRNKKIFAALNRSRTAGTST